MGSMILRGEAIELRKELGYHSKIYTNILVFPLNGTTEYLHRRCDRGAERYNVKDNHSLYKVCDPSSDTNIIEFFYNSGYLQWPWCHGMSPIRTNYYIKAQARKRS